MLRAAAVRLSKGGFGVTASQHKGFVWRSSPSAAAPGGTGEGGACTGPMGAAQSFQPGQVLRGPGSEEWLTLTLCGCGLSVGAAGGFGFPGCSGYCVGSFSSVFRAVFVPHPGDVSREKGNLQPFQVTRALALGRPCMESSQPYDVDTSLPLFR